MGAIVSTVFQSIFWKKSKYVLLLGLPGAGKTTFYCKLKYNEFVYCTATGGLLMETLNYKNISFTVTEVGGGCKLRPLLWDTYIDKGDCVIFVIDASNRENIEEARSELHRVVETRLEKTGSKECILLVVATKQDLPNCMSTTEIIDKMGLSTLKICKWYMQAISAKEENNLNIYEGLEWLSQQLQEISKYIVGKTYSVTKK